LGDNIEKFVTTIVKTTTVLTPQKYLESTQPPVQCVPGDLSLGVKRSGRETDHSLPASAEVKKMWIYTNEKYKKKLGRKTSLNMTIFWGKKTWVRFSI
jgi:hypothetical protein